jgi:hypothetical protein
VVKHKKNQWWQQFINGGSTCLSNWSQSGSFCMPFRNAKYDSVKRKWLKGATPCENGALDKFIVKESQFWKSYSGILKNSSIDTNFQILGPVFYFTLEPQILGDALRFVTLAHNSKYLPIIPHIFWPLRLEQWMLIITFKHNI